MAQHNLGVEYFSGEVIEKDERTAVELYQKAAKQGEENAKKALRQFIGYYK